MGGSGFIAATTTGPRVEGSLPVACGGEPFVESFSPPPAPAGPAEGWSASVSGASGPLETVWPSDALASGSIMESTAPLSEVPRSASRAGATGRATQQGQAYLWTRCSQTNRDAGSQ